MDISKDFIVSTADVAFKVDGELVFTGQTTLSTSLSVSMQEQEIVGGKESKLLYKYKYGRRLSPTIEMAEWNLAYIAANVGSPIFVGLCDALQTAECIALTNGTGILSKTPIGDVFIEKTDGSILKVVPIGNSITVSTEDKLVKATYTYNTQAKRITIDATSTPLIGELILTADKHNNFKGKVGEVQIHIPHFQISGNFDINLEAGGVASTKIEGDALAIEGISCKDGAVYAYITEIPIEKSQIKVGEIAATPSIVSININATRTISVIGIRGGMYSNINIDNSDCTITSDDATVATVDANGVITGVGVGSTLINVDYEGQKDIIHVIVA